MSENVEIEVESEVEEGKEVVDIELTEEQLDAILESLEESSVEDVDNKLFQNRYIYLNSGIEPETINEIVPIIHYYNLIDDQAGLEGEDRNDFITIYLNTQGGCVYSALNLYEEIKASRTPIKIILSGIAMSAGLVLFLATPHREMKDTATLLYHQARAEGLGGTIEDIERINYEFKRLQRICDELILKETSVTQKQLNKYNGKIKDWYIGKTEALKYGFIKED